MIFTLLKGRTHSHLRSVFAWCKSVDFAYSIHAIRRDSDVHLRWHFLTSARHANAHAARASLGAGPGKEAVTLPNSLWPSVILRLRPRELSAIGCKRLWASQKMGLTLHYLLKQDLNIRCFNHGETAPTLWCHISGLVQLTRKKFTGKIILVQSRPVCQIKSCSYSCAQRVLYKSVINCFPLCIKRVPFLKMKPYTKLL